MALVQSFVTQIHLCPALIVALFASATAGWAFATAAQHADGHIVRTRKSARKSTSVFKHLRMH